MMKLSEKIFVLTESNLYAIVTFAVLRVVQNLNIEALPSSIANETDVSLKSSGKITDIASTLHTFSAISMMTASIMTCAVMLVRIWIHTKFSKNAQAQRHSNNSEEKVCTYKPNIDTATADPTVKDDIGLAFGSTLPALVLHVIYTRVKREDIGSSKDWLILQLYAALLSCVGVSFVASHFMCTMQKWRRFVLEQRPSIKNKNSNCTKDSVCRKDADTLQHVDRIRILETMLKVLPIFVSYLIFLLQRTAVDPILSSNSGTESIGATEKCSSTMVVRLLLHIAFVFTSIESSILLFYSHGRQSQKQVENNIRQNFALAKIRTEVSPNPLQHVFSPGEFIVVSCFSSILATDFVFRYLKNDDLIPLVESCSVQSLLTPSGISTEIVVAQSGLLGCIFGVCIGTYISKWIISRSHGTKAEQVSSSSSQNHRLIMNCAIVFCTTIFTTLVSINTALTQFCVHNTNDLDKVWCSGSSAPFACTLPIQWLSWFLLRTDMVGSMNSPASIAGYTQLPRYVWLIYWCIILSLSAPVALYLAHVLCKCNKEDKKKKLTVISRKFFHFVAVTLFTPVTALSPKLMYLSYAIATALLVLVESLRLASNQLMEENRNEDRTSLPDVAVNRFYKLRVGVNQFFQTFYDEKDKRAMEGSFVVTHVALIVGCATPLWFNCNDSFFLDNSTIAPFVGIISLGVGDAVGAIVGTFFGRTRWPMSQRTVEGSAAMLMSLVACGSFLSYRSGEGFIAIALFKETMIIYLPLTILEAVTLQIDNLCLPIMGFVLSSLYCR